MPQIDLTASTYYGIVPGGRYAYFHAGVIDLWSRKVAWVRTSMPNSVLTAPDTVLIPSEQHAGLTLWNLNSGAEKHFAGEVAPHFALGPHHVALQQGHSLLLLNAREGRVDLELPVDAPILSVVQAPGRIIVLIKPSNTPPSTRLLVRTFLNSDGTALGTREIELNLESIAPAGSDVISPAFLDVDARLQPELCVGISCQNCPPWDEAARETFCRSLTGSSWTKRRPSEDCKPTPYVPFATYERNRPTEETVRALARMAGASMGWLQSGLSRGTFRTTNGERSCLWSLGAAARVSCTSASSPQAVDAAAAPGEWLAELNEATHDVRAGIAISRGAALIARAYDFSSADWALVLADGRYTGSRHAWRYLAMYSADGQLLDEDAVRRMSLPGSEVALLLDAWLRTGSR